MYVVLKKLYATNFKLKLEKNTLDLNADKVTKQWAKLSVALSLITLNMVNLELACLSLPTNEITEGEYSKISKLSPRKDKYRTKLPAKFSKFTRVSRIYKLLVSNQTRISYKLLQQWLQATQK